jgi:AcrR family transcriptional regulator
MPRSADQTRRKILETAYKHFRRSGFFRVGVDEIAAAAGITKRTLYYHFKSKDALLAGVLASQHEQTFAAFQNFGIEVSGDPEQFVDALFRELSIWSATPRWAGSGFTRLAMELADLPGHPARSVARKHKAVLEKYIADLLAKANVRSSSERAREIQLLAEGAMVMILIHGDRGYAEAAAAAAKRLLGAQVPRAPSTQPQRVKRRE